MKYFNKRFLLIALAGGIMLGGCKKGYLDVNDDPNRVTELNITPELIFPQAEVAVGQRVGSGNFTFLENWLGYTGASGSYAIDQRETSYNLDFAFSEGIWQNNYGVLFDLYLTKVKALAKGDTVLAGASMILSAKLWQETVDLFGNIPYTQAFNNNSYTQPAYDDAKAIYKSVMLSLDLAKDYMGRTAKATFKTLDVINKGDQAKWIRFANTLKLRMLIRTSEAPIFMVSDEISKIKDNGTQLNIIRGSDDVTVNPGYANETNKQSPFYATYGFTPTAADANLITRANVYFINLLTANADPRLQQIFAFATGTMIIGVTYGLAASNPTTASKFGAGLLKSPTQNQWIYTGFESMFLEAEAIARGWTAGNARAADSAAIVQNFVFLGVPNATTSAATYITNSAIANYSNAGTTALSQAKFIAYQKYISLAGVDPQESYADLRRLNFLPNTGYLSVNPGRIGTGLPVRIPYPQTEYTTNSANVNTQGTINIFSSKIFWQP